MSGPENWGRSRKFAVAVFYWFFRYVPDSVYFIEIAKMIWPNRSETFKRFVYAKCGGSEQDDFEAICDRFKAPIAEVTKAFDRIWIDEKPPFNLELPTRSSQLYHYTNDAIEILGREAEQAALERFRDAGPGFRWWQIAGVAGQGKSRLALEFLKSLGSDWQAGFLLDRDDSNRFTEFANEVDAWVPEKPTFIVVDDIFPRLGWLALFMESFSKRSTEFDKPVCLLIVERQPWNYGGLGEFALERAKWYCEVCSDGMGFDAQLEETRFNFSESDDFLDGIQIGALELSQLADITRQVASETNQKFEFEVEQIEATLRKIDKQGRPLYAYFLGKALAAGRLDVSHDAGELLNWVLLNDRGNRWISEFGNAETTPALGSEAPSLPNIAGKNPSVDLSLLASMVGQLDCNQVPWNDTWAPHNHRIVSQALVLVDGPISQNPEPIIPALQPDLLGEWFVLESLRRQSAFKELSRLAWEIKPQNMSDFVVRASQDFPNHPTVVEMVDEISKNPSDSAWKMEAYFQILRMQGLIHDEHMSIAVRESDINLGKLIRDIVAGGLENDVEFPDAHSRLLLCAATGDHLKAAEIDIDLASLNSVTSDGVSALMLAVESGSTETVSVLLNKGADPSIHLTDRGELSSLGIALTKGLPEIAFLLLQYGDDPAKPENDANESALHIASVLAGADLMSALCKCASNLDVVTNENEVTPLMEACRVGNFGAAKSLIACEAKVNFVSNSSGGVALLWAIVGGHSDIVELLLENDAKTEVLSVAPPTTPLITAVKVGRLDIVQSLVKFDCDVEFAYEETGTTALHEACIQSAKDVAAEVIRRSTSLGLKRKSDGATPLILVAQAGCLDLVNVLLASGAKAFIDDVSDTPDYNALMVASMSGHQKIVQVLLENGASVDTTSQRDGVTPLMLAASNGHLEVVRTLHEFGAPLNVRAKNPQITALGAAKLGGFLPVVAYLEGLGGTE